MMRTHTKGAISSGFAAFAALLLLVSPDPLAAQDARPVSGTVRDASTGVALPNVHVSGGGRDVLTDRSGRFTIQIESDSTTLRFHRIGYVVGETLAADFTGVMELTTSPVLLGEIVSTVQGRNQIAVGTALSVGTADREEIVNQGVPSLAEALRFMEGFSVARTGAWGSKAVLRGLGGERLAVMVDGSRLNRACTFGMDQGLATIDPATIERVEVLTGPGSTLYGSGNIGGVINVVTRRGDDGRPVAGEFRTGVSSAVPGGSVGGSLWLRGDRWDVGFAADAARYGDYRTPDGTVAGSGLSQATGDLKVNFAPTPAHRVQFQTQLYEARDIGWPGVASGEGSIPEERRYAASIDYGWQLGRGFFDGLSARAFLQRLDHHMVMSMTMGGGSMTSETDARSHSVTSGARMQARLLPAAHAFIDLGVETVQWDAEATRWMEQSMMGGSKVTELRTWPDVRIQDLGAFAQGEAAITHALTISAGARIDRVLRSAEDRPDSDEWVGTGNVGLAADLGRGFGLRSSFGMGYRVPDPTEVYGLAVRPDGFLYRGNPELKTETGRNVEVAVDYGTDRVSLSATAFRNDLRDLISPVTVPDEVIEGRQVREYSNIDRARLVGLTGSGSVAVSPALDLAGTVTYTRGTDTRTDLPLPQIPPLEGAMSITLKPSIGPDWVALDTRAAARQDRVATGVNEAETPGYATLDLRTGFSVAGNQIVAGVENLLDHHYRSHLDSPTLYQPGRNFYLRIQRRL